MVSMTTAMALTTSTRMAMVLCQMTISASIPAIYLLVTVTISTKISTRMQLKSGMMALTKTATAPMISTRMAMVLCQMIISEFISEIFLLEIVMI